MSDTGACFAQHRAGLTASASTRRSAYRIQSREFLVSACLFASNSVAVGWVTGKLFACKKSTIPQN